jgi:hypothetical protein|mmetsp:Transcript_27816/g.37151  ORF Transcript_27816/g.37151 Transcript_27816/m.37151 type:complete len:187 (+) Transcript_27816:322-882(+)|eukprot:CAMPEP_0185576694 /NCGR_PEP_ID=MMETSP0434-20130131/7561_1 /TAXON_ID=626734 ORGANISM="Favella taraikaensis, Strain Fe Narragansett Bay" /NCGR_SAMPLE_ID=MMETSP0434 /ASSEMBLY_ACC=CAM_ASM_000379 /LENGTH=186 /DNA_ID=CAMNT_0028193993 /DNA_START=1232 /DNA_END=1792 /DNA_ORIENTATION=+
MEYGEEYFWFTNEIIYTGDYFAMRFGQSGEQVMNVTMSVPAVDTFDTVLEKTFDSSIDWPLMLTLKLDLANGTMLVSIKDPDCDPGETSCLLFKQEFGLDQKQACIEWLDHDQTCFSLENSGWSPYDSETMTTRVWLMAQHEDSDSHDAKTTVGVAAALALTLALGVYARKRVRANRPDSDEYIRA